MTAVDARPARASAMARMAVRPPRDGGGRTAARWPRLLVAAAVAWNLASLRALTLGVAYLNDSSLHEQMVRFATAQLRAGHLPLTSWFPFLGEGSPQFLHYQSMPAILTGLVGLAIGPDVAFRWSSYLLVSLWPISVYLAARAFGAGRPAAAASAALAPFLVSAIGVGYEQHAYVWTGFGVWTQLWAMWTLPLAWAFSWRAIRDGRGYFKAVVMTALTVALHFETGYLALSVLLVWPIVAGRPLVARLRRAAVLLGGSLLASAWVIVPLVEQRRWAAVNEAFHGTLLVNGYGARRVFYWLVSGQLLDHGRLPVVTVFAALGLGLAWLAWSSDADGRALLVALAVCLLLAFGRTTFGSLADLVPGSADLFFRRFMMGAQLAALLLAGRGAAWLTAGGGRLLNARVPRWPPGLSRAVVLVAAVAVLAPAWLQLGAYDHRDGAAIAAQRQADDTQGAALDRLIAVIDRDGGGRTYAGMPSNWGQGFTVGTVPVFKYLESRDIDEVGYTLRTASLMTEPEYYFDARDPSDYRLFGIRYLILPARHQPPVRARLAMRSGPYWLWTIEGAGYVQAGRIVGEIAANRTNVGARSVALLRSGLAADGAYLSVRYGVDDGGNGRRPTVRSQASAGAVRAERADLDDGEAAATVRMRRPGVAVLSASYDPGWTAIVNGRRRTTRMVAPALVAVDVPAGTDHVVFRFRGYDDYPELLVLSGLTLAIIAIAPACVRRARRRRADLDQDGVLWRLRGPRVSLKPAAGSDSVAGARTASASLARTHMRSSGDHIGGGFVTRSDVTFSSGGVDCAAWLFRPDREGPCPLVVMAHGFSATRELRLDAYAERFCDSGLGVLVFDYRHFGASAGQPRQLLGIRMQQDDYRAAVSYARALEWVDSARVALFGTSFSGGHVLAVAARDQRIAAVVSQCPFTDGLASLPKLGPANIAKATVAGLRDQLADLVGRAPQYIPAVGPPGSFAVMTTPDSQPGFEALLPPESRWENRVAARIALRVASYRPGRSAAKVACPVLFCVCDGDTVAPAKTTLKYARAAPRGEIKHYPVGHFDIYLGETWERAVADQTEFFSRCLAGSRESAEIDDTVARS